MTVRVLVSMEGTGVSRLAGDVIDVGEPEALRLIDHGFAEPLQPETAAAAPAESATKPAGAKRVAKANRRADK